MNPSHIFFNLYNLKEVDVYLKDFFHYSLLPNKNKLKKNKGQPSTYCR